MPRGVYERPANHQTSPASDLNRKQTELITVMAGAESISVDIPENATLTDVEKTLQVAVNGYRLLTETAERIKPIIGRILLEIRNRRLYKSHYRNFTEYVTKRVGDEMRMGRTNAFDALKIAKAFPSLTEEEYHQIGASRLLLAARITDETQPNYREILETTKKAPTVEALKDIIDELKGQETSKRPKPFIIGIRVTPETMKRWQDLREQEGPDREPGDIFSEMLDLYVVRDHLQRKIPPSRAHKASNRPS